MRLVVEGPTPVGPPVPLPELGRLGPALAWLATVQGAWPPRDPSAVQRPPAPDGLDAGSAVADALADAGADLLVVGSDADPVPGLVALTALLGLEPAKAVALDDPSWAAVTAGVRDGRRRVRLLETEPRTLLQALDDPSVAGLTGLLAQAAVRRTPCLLDGSAPVLAAALLAERIAPGAPSWWLAGAVPTTPAGAKALGTFGTTGLLDLGLPGSQGAELALLVLRSGVALVADGA